MAKTNKTKATINDSRQELLDLTNRWKRALADYQNLEKRVKDQQSQFVRFANAGLLVKLLPVVDHLERASRHLKDEGLTMIMKQLREILDSEGVKPIEALAKPFDPQLMECVEKVAGPPNQVMEITEAGYRINDQVLRPVKVKVGTPQPIDNQHQSNHQQ